MVTIKVLLRAGRRGARGAISRLALTGVVASTLALGSASAARASNYPVIYNFPAGVAMSEVYPTPPGSNNWNCHPSAQHPRPVILVPGLSGSSGRDWQAASPLLANNGYCVFAYDFSDHGQESIEDAAAGLSSFVDRVLAATGMDKVDLVSHSEGGVILRYYVQFDGGAAKTHNLIQISPLNHGTTLYGVTNLPPNPAVSSAIQTTCPSCYEQGAGSQFMQKLNANGDTVPGVTYTVIASRNDEIITPWQSQLLSGSHVTNIVLQDQCSLDQVDHLASEYDSIALRDVLNALDPSHAQAPVCHPVLPGVGG